MPDELIECEVAREWGAKGARDTLKRTERIMRHLREGTPLKELVASEAVTYQRLLLDRRIVLRRLRLKVAARRRYRKLDDEESFYAESWRLSTKGRILVFGKSDA